MDANKKNKRRNNLIAAAVVLIISVIGVFLVFSEKQGEIEMLNSKNGELGEVLIQRDSLVNELIGAFNEIESNLDSINKKRNKLTLQQAEGSNNQQEKVLDGINQIDAMLDESSKRIEVLEKKLRNSGIELKSFKNKIASLTKDIQQQNAQITQLRTELEDRELALNNMSMKVDMMEDVIATANDSLAGQKEVIKEKDNELNKAYVAFGTSKELKEKGLLVNEGGFLGLGANKSINENFDPDYFIPLDIRETTFIPLHAKKAKIISDHPDSSYRFIENEGEIAMLEIDDPVQFWKLSKYALIEIK